jgi:leader peptidase (prepilin peptidase)/N-methyltransferase
MIQDILIYIFVALFGLCIGSFLNVVIYRTEEEKSFAKGRSFCPSCKHSLNWKDLFPVFSFLFLGGKCRYCREKISIQYPLVELVTGLIFVLILNFKFEILNQFEIFQFLNIIFWFYVASVLIIIFVYDLKHYLIPDNVLFPAIIIAGIYRIFEICLPAIGQGFSVSLLNYFYAILIGAGFFFAIWFVSQGKWMGFGDVKLAILLGLILGFPNILVGLFLSFLFGAIIGVLLMVLQKKEAKSEVPFGPFLIFGTFVALFWGTDLISWYLNLIL